METLEKDIVAVALMQNKIHFRDLLEEAKTKYTNLQHMWGTPAQSKEQALVGQVKALQAKLDKMDQQLKQKPTPVGGGRDDGAKRKIVCWHCDEDHPKRLCPNLDKPPVNPRAGGSDNNNNDGNKDGPKGKWAKPKDGEPHEKMINGSKWFYCTKCRGGKGG